MLAAIFMLIAVFFLYKLLIDGWLFKGILFIAGWIGLYILLCVMGADVECFRTAGGTIITWAKVVPTVICFLALLTTRE